MRQKGALRGLVAAVVAAVSISMVSPAARAESAGVGAASPVASTSAVSSTSSTSPTDAVSAQASSAGFGARASIQRINRMPGRAKVAYLTFDDGPDPRWTPKVTRVLRKHRVKGTFFVVGNSATRHPGMLRTLRSQGHVVANHTYSHPVLTKQPSAQVRSQLQRTDRAIGTSRCYRPPYGAVNNRVDAVAASLGLRYSVLWNVDSNDWRRPGATTIANTVVRTTRPGSIILMHDGGGNRSQTVAALDQSITRLKKQGYTFKVHSQCGRR